MKVDYFCRKTSHDNLFCGCLDRTDSTGIRFYLGNEFRQFDLGYLTFGTDATIAALAIPPQVERFVVDSYCTANATKV